MQSDTICNSVIAMCDVFEVCPCDVVRCFSVSQHFTASLHTHAANIMIRKSFIANQPAATPYINEFKWK